jgi:hypothetical protein
MKVEETGSPDASRSPGDQPLLAALLAEAGKRGDSLSGLAASLGVTYERIAQWRRGDSSIGSAKRIVHVNAARYLGIPTVLAILLSGQIRLDEFVWPTRSSLRDRLSDEIKRMRQSPYIGSFVPAELGSATEAIQLFVVFLYQELQGENRSGNDRDRYRWMSALQHAAADIHQHPREPGDTGSSSGAIFR